MAEPMTGVGLRPAQAEDCRAIWEWRNDPDTREASFHTDVIFFEQHREWFEKRFDSPDLRIRIILSPQGKEIGYVRFRIDGEEAEVSVALDSEERGKGYGPAALRAAAEELFSEGRVNRLTALIKHSNPGSRQAFERAGFRLAGNRTVGSDEAWEMICQGAGK